MEIKTMHRSVIVFCLLIFPLTLFSQRVMDLPRLDKLPIHSIHRIFQDKEGYVWYGTSDGLCRDDGYNIRIFRSDLHTSNVMQSNLIRAIAEDTKKQLWLGTNKGVYILDKSTFRIHQLEFPEIKEKRIITIDLTSDGCMWVGTSNGLYQFSPDRTLKDVYTGKGQINYFYEDREQHIWVCSENEGLCRINTETKQIECFSSKKGANESFIIQDNNQEYFWVGTKGNGIIRFDPNVHEDSMYVYQSVTQNRKDGIDEHIYNMVQDDVHDYIWVVTNTNLLVFRVDNQGMLEQVDTSSFLSGDNKMLSEIIKDKDKNLWVAAYDRKSFIINLQDDYVSDYTLPALHQRINGNPAIVSLCKDDGNVFWISQDRYGICLYCPDSDKLVHYSDCSDTRDQPLQFIHYFIKSNKKGKIWAMSQSTIVYGIAQDNLSMVMEETIDLNSLTDNPGTLETIYEDVVGNLWMGTTMGLFVYTPNTKGLESFDEIQGVVTGVTETNDGAVWVSVSNKGVYRIGKDKSCQYFPNEKSLSCIDATSDGKLWIGTFSGEVLFLDPQGENLYTDYSQICDMNGDELATIIVDAFNHVWLLTNQRVKEFNPKNNVYYNYSASRDLFSLDRFLPKSAYKDADNIIYFGGIPGFISIRSSNRLESIPKLVRPIITDIKIGGKSLCFDEHASFSFNNRFNIDSNAHNIEIHFSTLDYWNTYQIKYAYRLVGMDNDWNYAIDRRNTAFYNRLGKGTYTFQVKATDENGLWSEHISEIIIHRLPAWYETWWAYLCYGLFLCGLVWSLLYLYLQRIKERNSKEMAEQLAQMKLRYFTNISHDLMTPLTILSCIVEEMKSAGKEDPVRINSLQSNTLRLRRLLQQVLDFRRLESGNMKLNVSQGNIRVFIEELCKNGFAPLVKSKQISFAVSIDPPQIEGYFDFDKLDRILFNLLSNAFKYTEDGKEIAVKANSFERNHHTYLQIEVSDQGIGIHEKEQKNIFERFYNNRLSEAGMSNGIGLSLVKELVELHHGTITLESEPGKGSVFTVVIPIDKNSYSEEERAGRSYFIENEMDEPVLRFEDTTEEEDEPGDKHNLLLVEDNDELLSLMQNIFAREYNVFTAKHGKEALGIISLHPIDIVVSDITMPEMDGWELCRTIKDDIQTSHIIFILLTARITIEDRIESYQVNADDYIPKPFEMRVLRARLENLLRLREQKQAVFRSNFSIEISQLEVSSLDEQLITRALQVVETNLSEPKFDVVRLAEQLNITRATLSRKIKAITGQTALEFIRNIKMKHACRMLKNTSMSVSEIIIAVGYNDHKHFTATFKDLFGVTPSEYRKKNNPP